MKKSLLYSLAVLILTLPETLATEPVLFKDFDKLPLDIQVKIFSDSDSPTKALSVSKRIRAGMQNRYLWAKSDEGLTVFVDEAYDEMSQFIPDARIMKALADSSGLILLKRLVLMPGEAETKSRVRNVIVRHIVQDLFFSKDTLIEISRKYPDLTKSVLRLARGEFTHGCPLVYAGQLPQAVAPCFNSAELLQTHIEDNSIYRMWRFASHPEHAHINTVGLLDGEEYVLLTPADINGHMLAGEIKILHHGNVPKSWPLADVKNNPVIMDAQP